MVHNGHDEDEDDDDDANIKLNIFVPKTLPNEHTHTYIYPKEMSLSSSKCIQMWLRHAKCSGRSVHKTRLHGSSDFNISIFGGKTKRR